MHDLIEPTCDMQVFSVYFQGKSGRRTLHDTLVITEMPAERAPAGVAATVL